MAFEVQTQYRTVFFRHHLRTSLCCLFNHRYGRRGQSREYAGSSVFHVGFDRIAESVFGTFHEIASATAMCMDFYTAGQYIHSFYINQLCTDNGEVAIGYF